MRKHIASGEMEPMGEDNEAVYDERISPLMTQIIAICKEHKIPMVATFEYAPGGFCTTRLPYRGESKTLASAEQLITQGFTAFAITTTTK